MRASLKLENIHFKVENERKDVGKERKGGKTRKGKCLTQEILQVVQKPR